MKFYISRLRVFVLLLFMNFTGSVLVMLYRYPKFFTDRDENNQQLFEQNSNTNDHIGANVKQPHRPSDLSLKYLEKKRKDNIGMQKYAEMVTHFVIGGDTGQKVKVENAHIKKSLPTQLDAVEPHVEPTPPPVYVKQVEVFRVGGDYDAPEEHKVNLPVDEKANMTRKQQLKEIETIAELKSKSREVPRTLTFKKVSNDNDGTQTKKRELVLLNWSLNATADDRTIAKETFEKCPQVPGNRRCRILNDKSLYNESDIVIMSAFSAHRKVPPWPTYKLPHQKWLFYGHETPTRSIPSVNLNRYRDMFNLTASYKAKSDIYLPYGKCDDANNTAEEGVDYAKNKSNLAVWVVSNCESESLREEYVEELRKHMNVDIFGKCGKQKCKKMDHNCMARTIKGYKFYLALENSLCDEYMTEKVFRTLELGTVPIVLGAAHYKDVLPHKSFIDIRDFKSPFHLARYIKKLDKNDDLYNEYLAWKRHYNCEARNGVLASMICEICQYLHDMVDKIQVVPDIFDFWMTERECVPPEVFYENIFEI